MKVLLLSLVFGTGSLLHAADHKIGKLTINGILVAKDFALEPVFHTDEVKPNGTVLEAYCGNPSELPRNKVCVARIVGRPNFYYLVIHKESGENVYIQSGLTIIKVIPPIDLYQGYGVTSEEISPHYAVEKYFELEMHD